MVTVFIRRSPCLKTVHASFIILESKGKLGEKPEMITLTKAKSENFNKTEDLLYIFTQAGRIVEFIISSGAGGK